MRNDRDVVEGNLIGVDVTGMVGLAPQSKPSSCGSSGGSALMLIYGNNNRIGGTTVAARNVISGGGAADGIDIIGGCIACPGGHAGDLNVIQGNFIGTDVLGTHAIASADGIYLFCANNNLIGGASPGAGNLISGNTASGFHPWAAGVLVEGSTGLPDPCGEGNLIQGNKIGTTVSGAAPLPNGVGVAVDGGNKNLIGASQPGAGNIIAFNYTPLLFGPEGYGVVIDAAGFPVDGVGNTISGNSIHSNTRLGIELNHDAFVTPNDPGDADTGSNDVQNFPVITSVQVAGGSTTIQGTLNSEPQKTYTVEVFSNSSCNAVWDPNGLPDPQLAGEGETYLGSVSVSTDGAGDAAFTSTYPVTLSATDVVTATATNPNGSTSEFSTCADVTTATAGTIIVRKHTVPAGSAQSFAFTTDYGNGFSLKDGGSNTSGALQPGTYAVSETSVSGWDTSASCDDGSPSNAITLSPGETVTCTFTNTQRGLAKVVKTVSGAAPSGSQSFTFELRQGASTTQAGSTLESGSADAGNGGTLDFTTTLIPGTTYALCETVMPGWMMTLGPPSTSSTTQAATTASSAPNFSVAPGQTRSFAVDNATPGRTRSNDRLLEELGLMLEFAW